MTNFIQPAFICKNTPELREKLEVLGYYPHPAEKKLYEEYPNYVGHSLHTGRGFYSMAPIGYEEEVENEIYCGSNEDLFLAIATLRDDTDKYQFFVFDVNFAGMLKDDIIYPRGTFVRCMEDSWDRDRGCIFSSRNVPAHKASVSELIEYFGRK